MTDEKKPPATLDELITEINRDGYWIGSLFQNADGSWTARTVKYTPSGIETSQEFAHGATAFEALQLCWEEAKSNDPILSLPKAQRNYHLKSRKGKYTGKSLNDEEMDDMFAGLL